jgi:hypothetical protein
MLYASSGYNDAYIDVLHTPAAAAGARPRRDDARPRRARRTRRRPDGPRGDGRARAAAPRVEVVVDGRHACIMRRVHSCACVLGEKC